jgi:hypothetical protein
MHGSGHGNRVYAECSSDWVVLEREARNGFWTGSEWEWDGEYFVSARGAASHSENWVCKSGAGSGVHCAGVRDRYQFAVETKAAAKKDGAVGGVECLWRTDVYVVYDWGVYAVLGVVLLLLFYSDVRDAGYGVEAGGSSEFAGGHQCGWHACATAGGVSGRQVLWRTAYADCVDNVPRGHVVCLDSC